MYHTIVIIPLIEHINIKLLYLFILFDILLILSIFITQIIRTQNPIVATKIAAGRRK